MEKRTLLALFLIMAVFYVSQEFIWKKRTPPPAKKADTESTKPADTQAAAPTQSNLGAAPAAVAGPSYMFFDPGFIAANNRNIPVNDSVALENDQMRIVFSNLGGTIRSVVLKPYLLSDKKTPVDIIPRDKLLFDIALKLPKNGDRLLSNLHFEHEMDADGQGVAFFVRRDSTRLIERSYRLDKDFNLSTVLRTSTASELNGGVEGYRILWDSGVADTEIPVDDRNGSYAVKSMIDNKLQSFKFGQLKSIKSAPGGINWVLVRSKYFSLGIIPEKRLNIGNLRAFRAGGSTGATMDATNRTALTSMEDHYQLYFGPSSYMQLSKFQPVLKDGAEMGWKWLVFLSRFFLTLFSWLHHAIPNYGWVILVFALILKVGLYPLTQKSLRATQEQQKLQPLIQEIQRKYKKDQKQMQAELARLYKEHNTSPMAGCTGGCLPLLLQMPVFFALYPALRYSLELRQAHFMFWLKDLSIPDPYYVLPILMGVAMFAQSKLMPQPKQNLEDMDEKQRAAMQSTKMMMYIMPVFMFFIFKSMPSGLVLYWMSFNIYSIVQQYFVMRKQRSA
jgi:YidC/Oxa1 family membrane protein insertase